MHFRDHTDSEYLSYVGSTVRVECIGNKHTYKFTMLTPTSCHESCPINLVWLNFRLNIRFQFHFLLNTDSFTYRHSALYISTDEAHMETIKLTCILVYWPAKICLQQSQWSHTACHSVAENAASEASHLREVLTRVAILSSTFLPRSLTAWMPSM